MYYIASSIQEYLHCKAIKNSFIPFKNCMYRDFSVNSKLKISLFSNSEIVTFYILFKVQDFHKIVSFTCLLIG